MNNTANAQQMNFEVATLIETLKGNRDKHIYEYNSSVIGYKEKIEETLKNALKKFKTNNDIYARGLNIVLNAPVSYQKEYDTIIEMLTYCTDKTIMLDRTAFQQYVMDEWHWKQSFNLTSSIYNAK